MAVRDSCQTLMIYLTATIGWIVTYIIDVRGGGPTSGYISTGFFGGMQHFSLIYFDLSLDSAGLMAGRLALLWVNEKVGFKVLNLA